MRYKILLTGSNDNIISELFYQSGSSFECMTTSSRSEDIIRHIKYFNPDAIMFCLPRDSKNSHTSMFEVKDECSKRNISVITYGSKNDCDNFKRSCPGLVSLQLVMPMKTNQLVQSISDYLRKNPTNENNIPQPSMDELITNMDSTGIDVNTNIDSMADLENLLANMGLGDMDMSLSENTDSSIFGMDSGMTEIDKIMNEQNTAKADTNRRKHILIVDDDKGILKMVKSFLQDKYDVATALSGKVALKFLETKSTDLILLDYEMPGDRGPDVLEKIRSNPATENIPVIFLTGVTERDKITEVLALKPQGYLLKPINMQRLLETVSENI